MNTSDERKTHEFKARNEGNRLMDPNWISLRTAVNWPDGLEVAAIGDSGLLRSEKIGLFSSVRCPGDIILAAYDYAKKLRDTGTAVISGFHSPVEKECMRILLRGSQPIIICPAGSLANMRIPSELRSHIEKGRLLLLSPFSVSGHSKPARDGRMKTSHVESGIAQWAAIAAHHAR